MSRKISKKGIAITFLLILILWVVVFKLLPAEAQEPVQEPKEPICIAQLPLGWQVSTTGRVRCDSDLNCRFVYDFIEVASERAGSEFPSRRLYTVQAGDTLSGIAQEYRVSVQSIMQANNLRYSYIWAGQTLLIPWQ